MVYHCFATNYLSFDTSHLTSSSFYSKFKPRCCWIVFLNGKFSFIHPQQFRQLDICIHVSKSTFRPHDGTVFMRQKNFHLTGFNFYKAKSEIMFAEIGSRKKSTLIFVVVGPFRSCAVNLRTTTGMRSKNILVLVLLALQVCWETHTTHWFTSCYSESNNHYKVYSHRFQFSFSLRV